MRKIIGLLSILLLYGCSSATQGVRYYSLNLNQNSPAQENKKTTESGIKIIISTVGLAPFLRQQGLVLQQGNHEIVIANQHHWAEPVGQSIAKLLQSNLNYKSKKYYFERESRQWSEKPSIVLKLEFDRFHATDKSTVIVSGRYAIYSKDKKLVSNKQFLLSEKLSEDGYLHSVEMLEKSINKLSNKIINTINMIE